MIHRICFGLQHGLYFVEDRTYPHSSALSVAARNDKLDDTHMLREMVV
jgi:hypothetical protein